MIFSMVLFPEIFSNHTDKFNRLSVWLINEHGIVCPNIRDIFTAGGQGAINYNNKIYNYIPQIITKLTDSIEEIKQVLLSSDLQDREYFRNIKVNNPTVNWINLVVSNTTHLHLKINLNQYLRDKLL
jgi:hypothetical protein